MALYYSFRKSHQRRSEQHYSVKQKGNIDRIKNDRIVRLPWVLKFRPKLQK